MRDNDSDWPLSNADPDDTSIVKAETVTQTTMTRAQDFMVYAPPDARLVQMIEDQARAIKALDRKLSLLSKKVSRDR